MGKKNHRRNSVQEAFRCGYIQGYFDAISLPNQLDPKVSKKWHYCVNTVGKNDSPVQREGNIYATSEEDAIQKLIGAGIVCSRSYEFLELVETTDWLIDGLSKEQLRKEREEALNESKNNSGT